MLTYWGFNKVAVNNLRILLFMSSTVLSASRKTSQLDLSLTESDEDWFLSPDFGLFSIDLWALIEILAAAFNFHINLISIIRNELLARSVRPPGIILIISSSSS